MMLVLLALSVVSVSSIQQDAFAQNTGMYITASADDGSDKIMVSGQTLSKQGDVTIKVTSPSGNNLVDVAQVQPDMDGKFDSMFMVGDSWKEDGFYSITAKHGTSSLYSMTVFVEVTDGITGKTMMTESSMESGIFAPPAQEPDRGLSIKADAVIGSTMIGISGMTDKLNLDVTLRVAAPNGNIIDAGQVAPGLDGSFATDINIGGPLWKQDGDYVVSAQQGTNPNYSDSVIVEIEDGVIVPEFGTIAVMVLAAAIISIVAITARSRLSIMPRY